MSRPLDARQEALRRVLAWLGANAGELLRVRPSWVHALKRFAELGMLAGYILDGDLAGVDPSLAVEARRWLEATWEVTRRGEFLVEAVASDPAWTSLATTYAGFHRHGLRNARLEELLAERAREARHPWFVALATGCAYRALGIPSHHDVEALAAEAWCARIPTYQMPDIGVMYETTHVVMWLAGTPAMPAGVEARLRAFVPRWSEHYRAAHNPDIVAELVLAAHHLGGCASDATWAWLLGLQTAGGSVREVDVPSPALGRFHVTLVVAMAAAACLGRCRVRP